MMVLQYCIISQKLIVAIWSKVESSPKSNEWSIFLCIPEELSRLSVSEPILPYWAIMVVTFLSSFYKKANSIKRHFVEVLVLGPSSVDGSLNTAEIQNI